MRQYFLEDDDELTAIYALFSQRKKERSIKWSHDRVNWATYEERLHHSGSFDVKHRMPAEAFYKLVVFLRPSIAVNEKRSMAGSSGNEPIYLETVCAVGLRWLGGEVERSLEVFGISRASCYRIIDGFLAAIICCDALSIRLPRSDDELKEAAEGWNSISSAAGLFHGVVGAIDGWLCPHSRPREQNNQLDFFSGHYMRFGSNVQAVCDARLRFICIAFAAPGKTNDLLAFRRCYALRDWLDELHSRHDARYYLIGDNAYLLHDSLLIPFSGASRSDEAKDSFNFFLSEMRIRIEMAFGLLTTKWRVFRRETGYDLSKTRDIVQAAARLHNFVINHHLSTGHYETEEIDALNDSSLGLGYNPTMEEAVNPSAVNPSAAGTSQRREWLVRELNAIGLSRPQHNIDRNYSGPTAAV